LLARAAGAGGSAPPEPLRRTNRAIPSALSGAARPAETSQPVSRARAPAGAAARLFLFTPRGHPLQLSPAPSALLAPPRASRF
jgi:hypothetical protein